MNFLHALKSGALGLLVAALPVLANAPRAPVAPAEAEAHVVVRLKPGSVLERDHALALGLGRQATAEVNQRRADRLAPTAGVTLHAGRALTVRTHVLSARGIDSATLAQRLAGDPNIESAVVDRRMHALRVPNDPLYAENASRSRGPVAGQWYLRAPAGELVSAVNVEAAWDRTQGDPSIVVAILDTGVLFDHLDLAGRLLPGYDMVSDAATANDGGGRDNDATDPGDWVTADECGAGEPASPSTWHGTMTTALIGAATDNGVGMAGIAPASRLLPVRVLGKCGGMESDIAAGMLWAAGIDQPGLPGSGTPARVINLSLGGPGSCGSIYPPALAAVLGKGVVVVAAAGNSAGLAVGAPANCSGVLGVAGLRHAGSKVGYSDLGPEIAISAPGGNCVNVGPGEPCLYPILSAINSGTQGPLAGGSTWTDSFKISVGTSFSSPIVAGTVALMLAVQPQLTPAEVKASLQQSARAFPATGAGFLVDGVTPVPACHAPTSATQDQCYCAVGLCGAGMLDATAAVAAAGGVHARIDVSPTAPVAGSPIELSSAGSLVGAGRNIVAWQWLLISGGGVASGFAGAANAAGAEIHPAATGTLLVRLTVTDDQGGQSSVDRQVIVNAPPVVTPPADSGGGGGGAFSGYWLLGLALAIAALARERRLATCRPPRQRSA